MIRRLARRFARRLASRVARNELFEKAGERAPITHPSEEDPAPPRCSPGESSAEGGGCCCES